MNAVGITNRLLLAIIGTALCVAIVQAAEQPPDATANVNSPSDIGSSSDVESSPDLGPSSDAGPSSEAEFGSEVGSSSEAGTNPESSSGSEPGTGVGPASDAGPSAEDGRTSNEGPGSVEQSANPQPPPSGEPVSGAGRGSETGSASLGDETKPMTKPSTVSPTSSPQYPGYTLYNGNEICFRARLNGQILITYYTTGLIKTKILTRTLDIPETSQVEGTCGKQRTTFSLSWADGNYTLTFDFVQKETSGGDTSALKVFTWFSDSIQFTFDTTNKLDFPHVKTSSLFTAETADGEVHFEAPANFSYDCTTEEDITLYVMKNGSRDQSVIESVDLSVWDVKIQAFEVPQTGVFDQSASCKPDIDKNVPQQNIVPVAVAACLAGIIVVIVIAYFFIKNRPSTQYSAME